MFYPKLMTQTALMWVMGGGGGGGVEGRGTNWGGGVGGTFSPLHQFPVLKTQG